MTIKAEEFIEPALSRGFSFWSGVPCSFLTPFINFVIQDDRLDYIGAASEGEAVGIAAGASLVGRRSVVICQNSGLGNAVNPLTSLAYPFKIPLLVIVTHRGAPGLHDEPQHEQMGRITGELLTTIEIPWRRFPEDRGEIAPALDAAEESMRATGRPYAMIMEKGAVAEHPLVAQKRRSLGERAGTTGAFTRAPGERMKRISAIEAVRGALGGDEAIVATTGMIGRELFTLGHRENQIYIVGSMGCASGIGLGLHEGARGKRPVVVLDGDGAALMKLGTLATIGHYAPKGLVHVILDNESHDSTGGQATVSPTVDFALVAAACGYTRTWRVDSEAGLAEAVREARSVAGPSLVHVKVAPGSPPKLGRPTLRPDQVKEQFMSWLSRSS